MSVQLAFIGAGGIAQWQHFDNLETVDDAEIVAACDVVPETAEEAAERFDAAAFTDHREFYAAVDDGLDVDAVFVCLPPFAHEDQEIMAAERGLDLFVEKPLALSTSKAREIRDAVAANDVLAQVGYDWRYSRGVERALELLDGREIGLLEGRWWSGVAGGEDHWWRHRDRSGGQVVEQATHIVDTIRYLGGDVERVSAAGANRLVEEVDFPDVTSATMDHESGIVSHLSTSCAVDDSEMGVEIVAEDATLSFDENHIEGVVDGTEIDESFETNPYAVEVEDFVDAVASGDHSSIRSTYDDAIRTFELTLAINESIDEGEPIRL